MSFSYRLAVLTHGDAAPLVATLESFVENVTPRPLDIVVVWDGPTKDATDVGWHMPVHVPFEVRKNEPSLGFCGATRRLWEVAIEERPGIDPVSHVFHLEHDFEFERPVDLRHLAVVLNSNPGVAQMSLLRHPEQHELPSLVGEDWERRSGLNERWLKQSTYFSTNPSLIPVDVMRDNEWASGPNCEGRMTIQLRDAGYSFGVWGHGEPQIKHTGVRSGHGY